MIFFLISFFLKENINSIALACFMTFTFLLIVKEKDYALLKKSALVSLPLLLYFFLAAIGVIINEKSNLNYLVRLNPFLLSPFFVYYFAKFSSSFMTIVKYFVVANITFLIFLDLMAIKDMVLTKSLYVVVEGREYYRFLYKRLTGEYFNHIYLSAYSLFSIILLSKFKLFKKKITLTLSVFFLVLNLALLASRAVVLSIILAATIYLIILSIKNKKYVMHLVLFFCFFGLCVFISYQYRDTLLFNRYSQVFEWYKKKDVILERNYSINNRLKLYIIGASMFEDFNRYGINGTGLAPTEIEEKYIAHFSERFVFKTNTYNAHNQFINNFIDWGVLGVLFLGYLVQLAIRVNLSSQFDWVTFFWLSFCIILMMESILIRHRGIVFFVFFFALFALSKKIVHNEKF